MDNDTLSKQNNTTTYDKLNDHIKIISVPVHLSKNISEQYGGKQKINLLILKNESTQEEIVLGELSINSSDNRLDSLKKLCSSESMQLSRLVDKDIDSGYKIKLINGLLNKISTICDVEISLKYTQEGYDMFYGNNEYSRSDSVFEAQKTVVRNSETYNMETTNIPYDKLFRDKSEWDKTVSLNSGRNKVRYTKSELLELKNETLTEETLRNFVAANKKTINRYIEENEDIKQAFENIKLEDINIFYGGVVDRMLQERITELEMAEKRHEDEELKKQQDVIQF